MNFPSIQTNNFFERPFDILEMVNRFKFKISPEGDYPGQRTVSIHLFNKDLFQYVNSKVIRLLYPNLNTYDTVEWHANTFFQKIKYEDVDIHINNKENPGVGWVHTDDPSTVTAMIYMSPSDLQSGTSIYVKRTEGQFEVEQNLKRLAYSQKQFNKDEYTKQLNVNIGRFEELVKVKSLFNSLFVFDSSLPHSANFNMLEGQERLTLISFISIKAPHFPVPEMKKIV